MSLARFDSPISTSYRVRGTDCIINIIYCLVVSHKNDSLHRQLWVLLIKNNKAKGGEWLGFNGGEEPLTVSDQSSIKVFSKEQLKLLLGFASRGKFYTLRHV